LVKCLYINVLILRLCTWRPSVGNKSRGSSHPRCCYHEIEWIYNTNTFNKVKRDEIIHFIDSKYVNRMLKRGKYRVVFRLSPFLHVRVVGKSNYMGGWNIVDSDFRVMFLRNNFFFLSLVYIIKTVSFNLGLIIVLIHFVYSFKLDIDQTKWFYYLLVRFLQWSSWNNFRGVAAYTLSRHGVHIGRLKKIK
jgi:hypothetical protein